MTDKASFPNVSDCGSAASLELRGEIQPVRRRTSRRSIYIVEDISSRVQKSREPEEMEASNDGGRGCVGYVSNGEDVLMPSNCGGQRVAFRKTLVPPIKVTPPQRLCTSNMSSTFERDVLACITTWALASRFQKFKTSDPILQSEASTPRWRFRTTTFGLHSIEDCSLV